ncbi:hypothetical protein HDR58_01520 [bacterium]|nr:hypothetical protein [bacterium]
MNLINSTVQNMNIFTNWVDSTPVPQIIDTVTYDLYESNNPFRYDYQNSKIENKPLRYTVNATKAVGAEVFSAFTNPYYLIHKVVNIPTACNDIVEAYKKFSQND